MISPEVLLGQYREKVHEKLNVVEVESRGVELIPIFPLLRRATGLRLRDGNSMTYVLSIILDSQPQINLLGPYQDRICANQIGLLADGIVDAGLARWLNLLPQTFSYQQTRSK